MPRLHVETGAGLPQSNSVDRVDSCRRAQTSGAYRCFGRCCSVVCEGGAKGRDDGFSGWPAIAANRLRRRFHLRHDRGGYPPEADAELILRVNRGILKVAKECGVGTGTVQRVKAEMQSPFDAASFSASREMFFRSRRGRHGFTRCHNRGDESVARFGLSLRRAVAIIPVVSKRPDYRDYPTRCCASAGQLHQIFWRR